MRRTTSLIHDKRTFLRRFFPSIVLAVVLASGCTWVSYYDPTTYKNLTELKAEVSTLYESFATSKFDSEAVQHLQLKLRQVYEYEKGKGEKNGETAKQVTIIRTMVDRHTQDRISAGPWSAAHLANTKENIEEAFDIAIRTERLKNKND
jgi:hypothetical protein